MGAGGLVSVDVRRQVVVRRLSWAEENAALIRRGDLAAVNGEPTLAADPTEDRDERRGGIIDLFAPR
jgi:hypothetical protein